MRVLELRFLTAFVVVGVCTTTVLQGAGFVAFSWARYERAAGASGTQATAAWTNVPGVGCVAREAALKRDVDPLDSAQTNMQHERLIELLSTRPLASPFWLSLAALRLADGFSFEKVRSSLVLSTVTGPNENRVMTQRAIFGLWLWERLTPELRKAVINDIAGALFPDPDIIKLRDVWSSKSDAVKHDVRKDLLENAGLTEKDLNRIGLRPGAHEPLD
jgi:hypothetical protein